MTDYDLPELGGGDLYRIVRRGDLLAVQGRTDRATAVYAVDPGQPLEPTLIDDAWFFIPSAHEKRIWTASLDRNNPGTGRALDAFEKSVSTERNVPMSRPRMEGGR